MSPRGSITSTSICFDLLSRLASAVLLILRCERSEPRRMQAPAPRPLPSRAASRPPQDEVYWQALSFSRRVFCSRPSFASRRYESLPPQIKRREAERRQAHPSSVRATHPHVATRTCFGRGSAPHSQMLPPESAAGALASRRSTAVLAAQINATAQPRPRFARTGGHRRYPHHRTRLQRCTSRAGHKAGRSMPKPPGSGVTNPARRNRTRSVSRPSPVTSLRERDETMTFERRRKVK
jgi:hypothetical protein